MEFSISTVYMECISRRDLRYMMDIFPPVAFIIYFRGFQKEEIILLAHCHA